MILCLMTRVVERMEVESERLKLKCVIFPMLKTYV